jgi:hypothetical protein
MRLHIRDARRDDAEVILGFITELAIYEKAEHEVLATVADSVACLTRPRLRMR